MQNNNINMENNSLQNENKTANHQFSNTEPMTHAQRVAIANQMSNSKQSSVEMLFQEMLEIQQLGKTLSFDENLTLIEKYKAIHKEETKNAYWAGIDDHLNQNKMPNSEGYYNELFEGNNEQTLLLGSTLGGNYSIVEWIEYQLKQLGITHFFSLREILQHAKAINNLKIKSAQMDMFIHLNNLPYGLEYFQRLESAEEFANKYIKSYVGEK